LALAFDSQCALRQVFSKVKGSREVAMLLLSEINTLTEAPLDDEDTSQAELAIFSPGSNTDVQTTNSSSTSTTQPHMRSSTSTPAPRAAKRAKIGDSDHLLFGLDPMVVELKAGREQSLEEIKTPLEKALLTLQNDHADLEVGEQMTAIGVLGEGQNAVIFNSLRENAQDNWLQSHL
jgi:hypothetical protein